MFLFSLLIFRSLEFCRKETFAHAQTTFSVICSQELENKHWSHLNGTSRIILIEDGRRSSEEQTCGHYYVE